MRDRSGTEYEASSLSDGTLRILALAVLEEDPSTLGLFCIEEPENGIHPQRMPAMLRLLHDLATDTDEAVDEHNPLRQVIINTHSPAVVGQVEDDDLLLVEPTIAARDGSLCQRPVFRWLADTWRDRAFTESRVIPPGLVVSYLNLAGPALEEAPAQVGASRVADRPEIRRWLQKP